MNDDPHIATLMHPIDTGLLPLLANGEPVLCVGLTEPLPDADADFGPVRYIQGFRPDFLKLAAGRCDVMPAFDDTAGYGLALVRLGRHRGQNESWIAAALARTRIGGYVVAAGGKTDGAASLRKRLSVQGLEIGHTSKNHGHVFWIRNDDRCREASIQLAGAEQTVAEGRFHTAPGMFSHKHADPGSRLLADHIPDSGIGSAADFCAGWGYLSACLLERCPATRELHLYEADFASVEAARRNVLAPGNTVIAYFWHDLLREPVDHRYDLIVMNPPFHTDREAEPELGGRLIEIAAKSLRPRGRLLMVANRQLPYEAALSAHFSGIERLAEDGGYKVILARR